MKTHTPGPWSWLRQHGQQLIESRSETVASVSTLNDADAHLIAAAPDMLETLAEVRETVRNLSGLRAPIDEHIAVAITKNALSKIDAVIAKAKGRAA